MLRPEKRLILDLCEREGVSQAELARRLDQPRSRVTARLTENSGRSMLVSELVRFADALGYELQITATRR